MGYGRPDIGHYTRFAAAWQTTLTVRHFTGIVGLKMKDGGALRETEDPCDIIIRACDGSLADAEGLLAVERATFDESPYGAEQVRAMLAGGPQRAWLAVAGATIVGFVIAFLTHGLRGPCWEIDLLAVHPDWIGRGLATRLIQAATAGAGAGRGASRARAVVAADNDASARAFARAGFQPAPEVCNLLICRLKGLEPRPWSAAGVTIREAASVAEAAGWLGDLPSFPAPAPDLTLLLAEQQGQPAGYAELIDVQTILYRGVWIESLAAFTRAVREALIQQAVNRAIAAGLDEIGAMVPHSNRPWQEALLPRGFRSLGDFCWLVASSLSPTSASPPVPVAQAQAVQDRQAGRG